jgi:hypothetical protein
MMRWNFGANDNIDCSTSYSQINCQNEGFAQNKNQMAEGNFVRRRFDALPDELQRF